MRYQKIIQMIIITCFLLFPHLVTGNESSVQSLVPLVDYLIDMVDHHRNENFKPVPILAIGGCPGVGKTYLTKTLASILYENGIRCIILPLDHFNLSPEERKKIGTEWDIRHFKAPELQNVLFSIFSGKKLIEKPTCNQLTGEIGKELIDLNEIDLILFDGLYALCSEASLNFFDCCSAGVFVEADESDIYKWKWEREQKKVQPRTPEQFKSHMQALINEFQLRIAYSKANALFIIQKDSNHNYHIDYRPQDKLCEYVLKAA